MRAALKRFMLAISVASPAALPAGESPSDVAHSPGETQLELQSLAAAQPVADAALDSSRGGFELPSNLHASLRLERAAYVNGERVVSVSADIPDLAAMTAEQASALAHAAGTLVIQGGPGNTFDLIELGPAATVIQNTLNDQHLVAMTTVSVEVNSLRAFRETAFQDGLRDGLGGITGVR